MNAKCHFRFLSVILMTCVASSCATIKNTSAAAAEKISGYAKLPKLPEMPDLPSLKDTPVARLMPAGGLDVVEVREKDLKELPTGQERAKAFRKERKKGLWFFDGPLFSEPLYFEEPSLPEPGSEVNESLLPPLEE